MTIERLLRVIALIIPLLALIDPTLTFASKQRPVVALSIVESPSLARPFADGKTGTDRARHVRAQLEAALSSAFEVREGPAPDAEVQLLIGDGSFPADTPIAEAVGRGAPVYALALDEAPSPNVRVLRIDAPARVQLGSRLRINAIVEARGMAGRTTTITLRADDLEMARATHTWTQAAETASIGLDVMPFRTGLIRLMVVAEPLAIEVTQADNTMEGAVDVTNEKIAVLFVEARPSWTTRFARQALEADERFDIRTLSRVSRGLTATTPDTPQTLTLASLEPFAAVIVGAPDALRRADVDALREFARVRGGLVIFAPDRIPSGAYVDLLPARAFDEKLLEEPGSIRLGGGRVATGRSDTGGREPGGFSASELAVPRDLLPGAEVLGRGGDSRSGIPLIVSSPLGDGEVVFIGALDAWRFRAAVATGAGASNAAANAAAIAPAIAKAATSAAPDRGDFDAAWRQLVATFGARVAGPISVSLDSPVAAPGGRVSMRVRLRRTLLHADGSVPPLIARLRGIEDGGPRGANGAGPRSESRPRSDDDATRQRGREAEVLRLWPADQEGLFTGTLNAPPQTGVYAVSVGFDRETPRGEETLLVTSNAPVAAVAWDGLRTFVDAHGGIAISSTELPRLIDELQHRVQAPTVPRARHPFRSAWWMLPFAACLGGEWWLRRRRGQR